MDCDKFEFNSLYESLLCCLCHGTWWRDWMNLNQFIYFYWWTILLMVIWNFAYSHLLIVSLFVFDSFLSTFGITNTFRSLVSTLLMTAINWTNLQAHSFPFIGVWWEKRYNNEGNSIKFFFSGASCNFRSFYQFMMCLLLPSTWCHRGLFSPFIPHTIRGDTSWL